MSATGGGRATAARSVPRIGLGTAVQGPRPDPVRRAVLRAIDLGYRHFDTAAHYATEAPIGEAIAEAVRAGTLASRDEAFVTSKVWCADAHRDRVLPALRRTLSNLQMEYVDLYLVHWPVTMKAGRYTAPFIEEDFEHFDMRGVWEAMEECHRLGLAKAIGVCNFSRKKLETLFSFATIPPTVNQVEINVVWQQRNLREFCREKGIQLIAYSPLGAKGTHWGSDSVMDSGVLHEIAKSKGKTVAQPRGDGLTAKGRARRAALVEWWVESKKLWEIVGPAILQRIALYGINVVSQAFIGHIGDLELAAFSIAATVVAGFNFGFLLGMASALETLCGQAFGAKKHHMLGVYLQRSWIVLLLFAAALTPTYIFMEDLLLLIGQSPELSRLAGQMSIWLLPQHFAMAMLLPLTRFLQSQLKNWVTAYTAGAGLALHVAVTYLLVHVVHLGFVGAVIAADMSWWLVVLGQFLYVVGGGCPLSWKGFSMEAFADFWEFIKLSSASGVMLCLENWYYRLLVLLTGYLPNAEIAVDALSICQTINGWEMMIPFGFLAATGVRVANELGAGSGKGARFAIIVSITTSVVIGLVFWCLILYFDDKIALLFTTSRVVLDAVHKLSVLLAFTILLNSVQPVLSGVAVGSGWQALVAYVNVGTYYFIGVPLGVILGWPLNFGVGGIWSGMIGGTAVQTLLLAYITVRCDWDEEAKKASKRMEVWASSK